jgi:hypothetical protein
MDEPNLSSKTTTGGDPVLFHLKTIQEFGKPAFPRGAMLEGAKDPGHFFGKGYPRGSRWTKRVTSTAKGMPSEMRWSGCFRRCGHGR